MDGFAYRAWLTKPTVPLPAARRSSLMRLRMEAKIGAPLFLISSLDWFFLPFFHLDVYVHAYARVCVCVCDGRTYWR